LDQNNTYGIITMKTVRLTLWLYLNWWSHFYRSSYWKSKIVLNCIDLCYSL